MCIFIFHLILHFSCESTIRPKTTDFSQKSFVVAITTIQYLLLQNIAPDIAAVRTIYNDLALFRYGQTRNTWESKAANVYETVARLQKSAVFVNKIH